MTALFGSKKDKDNPQSTGNGNDASEALTVTDAAREKLAELIANSPAPVLGVRIIAEAESPMNPQYSLGFVQEGEEEEDDIVFDFGEFKVYIDEDSMAFVEKVQLDFISGAAGTGFRIERKRDTLKLEGPLAEKVQKVIEEEINPALALHGGFVQLIDVKDTTVYIELGGGCRGCGMVDVTLKQGIEVQIKQRVPEITEILDATDHASGNNPYYQPSK